MLKFIAIFLFFISFSCKEIFDENNCFGHGHKEEGNCICASFWKGQYCKQINKIEEFDVSEYKELRFYDWNEIFIQRRLEKLYNLIPDSNKNEDDPMFPQNDFSFKVDKLSVEWNSLKKISQNSTLWGKEKLKICESIQGSLRNCYIFAVLASILESGGEKYIRDAIPFINEKQSFYVTKWFLFGRFIYVSVNDFVPTINNIPFGANVAGEGFFWAAILEKAWAKIWGSYEAITDKSEELFVSALTRTPLIKIIKISNFYKRILFAENFKLELIEESSSYIKLMNEYSKKIFLGKTIPNIKYLIGNHIFSILKVLNVTIDSNEEAFLKLYNPWGIDVPDNIIPLKTSRMLEKYMKISEKNQNSLQDEIRKNDGIFLVHFNDILYYFERLTSYDLLDNYEIFSNKLFLNSDIETNFSINFKLKNINEEEKVFFIFNQLYKSDQIKHYKINNLKINPEPKSYEAFGEKNDSEKQFFQKEYKKLIYIGGFFSVPNKTNEYNLIFTIRKKNYEIFDTVYLTFQAPKNTFSLINITKNMPLDICPNECSSNGQCNKLRGTCACNSNYFGNACTLTADPSLNDSEKKNLCNPNTSLEMSNGKCKCFPGYQLKENSNIFCIPCQDSGDFSKYSLKEEYDKKYNKITLKESMKNYRKIEYPCVDYKRLCTDSLIRGKCPKTCMVGTCFIPGAQNACRVNGCFGRGLCTPRGICSNCALGYTGTFCEKSIANATEVGILDEEISGEEISGEEISDEGTSKEGRIKILDPPKKKKN